MLSLLMPGTVVQYGNENMRIGAVGWTGGERYYWLVALDGAVSMLPAFVVEALAAPEQATPEPKGP